jgi:DNA-binding MarR family transcriptional regulator
LPTLATAVLHYLQEVLGIEAPGVKPWARANELPYFLRDAFQFSELELLGQPIVLAIGRTEAKQSLSEVRTWLDKVKVLAGQPAVYVTGALASYDRRRLIEQKVPFIVPGNQLYLPDLGLDLREYFRQRAPATEAALSPSAQAMLITALLRQPWQSDWQPSKVAVALGYTPMTLSRAVKELTAAGLATAYTVGRSRWLRMELPPEQVWERVKPALRTPVRRTVWVAAHGIVARRPSRIAGLSALARYSMLAEPEWPVYALTAADWKTATDAGVRELPEPESGAQEWQLWSYGPALVLDATTVDPLSLTLSLQENANDRIQLALDELKGQFPW